jgi:hypothetical protein
MRGKLQCSNRKRHFEQVGATEGILSLEIILASIVATVPQEARLRTERFRPRALARWPNQA